MPFSHKYIDKIIICKLINIKNNITIQSQARNQRNFEPWCIHQINSYKNTYKNASVQNSFLLNLLGYEQLQNKNYIMSYSLQVSRHKKRAFLSTLKKASVTVEAALVTSVFIAVLIPFIGFLGVIKMQMDIQIILENIARKMTQTIYYEEELLKMCRDTEAMKRVQEYIDERISIDDKDTKKEIYEKINHAALDIYIYGAFVSEYGADKLDNSHIKNGILGLDFTKSKYNQEKGIIEIVLDYDIEFPLVPKNMLSVSDSQRVIAKVWNGSVTKANTENVYITKSEDVYHTTAECPHLNIDIQAIKYLDIKALEDANEATIRECELCGVGDYSDDEIVYTTKTGDCYHAAIDCGTISRTVMAIDITEIGERRLCNTCGKSN